MANGHGGPRSGAGRPKKPLAEKVLAGNPGKRDLKVLEFETPALTVPTPPDFLADMAADLGSCPGAKEIYEQTAAWLETTAVWHGLARCTLKTRCQHHQDVCGVGQIENEKSII